MIQSSCAGNKEYAAQFDKCLDKTPKDEKPDFVDVKMFRVVNKSDIVPQVWPIQCLAV